MFIFNILGEKIWRAYVVWLHTNVPYWVFKQGSVSYSFILRKPLIVLVCCTVFSILDMFTIWLLRNIKWELYFCRSMIILLCVNRRTSSSAKRNRGKGSKLTFWKYSNKDVYIFFRKKVIKWGLNISNKFRVW